MGWGGAKGVIEACGQGQFYVRAGELRRLPGAAMGWKTGLENAAPRSHKMSGHDTTEITGIINLYGFAVDTQC